jgi:hypothetical protein
MQFYAKMFKNYVFLRLICAKIDFAILYLNRNVAGF